MVSGLPCLFDRTQKLGVVVKQTRYPRQHMQRAGIEQYLIRMICTIRIMCSPYTLYTLTIPQPQITTMCCPLILAY
jgi:hypothetical protein